MPKIRSVYSQAPFRISMCDHGGEISTGTAFTFEDGGDRFLLTNWHNVTGKDFFSERHLNATARTPLWLEIHVATLVTTETIKILPRRIDLYQDIDAPFEPLWQAHPTTRCDVVALPLPQGPLDPPWWHHPANKLDEVRIPVMPGLSAFVIGFPQGLSTGPGLPIWKATFVASEPEYDVKVVGMPLPAIFLDGRTRPGMSGSPVFAQYNGTWDGADPFAKTPEGSFPDTLILGGSSIEFIGIYSGRLAGGAEDDAALGICWKESAIIAVCRNKQEDRRPMKPARC